MQTTRRAITQGCGPSFEWTSRAEFQDVFNSWDLYGMLWSFHALLAWGFGSCWFDEMHNTFWWTGVKTNQTKYKHVWNDPNHLQYVCVITSWAEQKDLPLQRVQSMKRRSSTNSFGNRLTDKHFIAARQIWNPSYCVDWLVCYSELISFACWTVVEHQQLTDR